MAGGAQLPNPLIEGQRSCVCLSHPWQYLAKLFYTEEMLRGRLTPASEPSKKPSRDLQHSCLLHPHTCLLHTFPKKAGSLGSHEAASPRVSLELQVSLRWHPRAAVRAP